LLLGPKAICSLSLFTSLLLTIHIHPIIGRLSFRVGSIQQVFNNIYLPNSKKRRAHGPGDLIVFRHSQVGMIFGCYS
jgi:hypothetical protein